MNLKFLKLSKSDSQSHTQTSFKNKEFVFSDLWVSQIRGSMDDKWCSLDKSGNWTIFCPAKHSKCNEYFWVSGKIYGVKSTSYSLEMLSKSKICQKHK